MSDTTAEEFPLPGLPGEMRLPSGGWAVFAPFESLTDGDVRKIRAALNREGTGDILGGASRSTRPSCTCSISASTSTTSRSWWS